MIQHARYEADGTVTVVREDETIAKSITSASRFWPDVEMWLAAGNQIEAYADVQTFHPLSPRQLRLMMLQIGLTDTDIEAQITAIPDPTERAVASIEWKWATRYDRTHPLVAALATALEFTDAELDALWSYAADL